MHTDIVGKSGRMVGIANDIELILRVAQCVDQEVVVAIAASDSQDVFAIVHSWYDGLGGETVHSQRDIMEQAGIDAQLRSVVRRLGSAMDREGIDISTLSHISHKLQIDAPYKSRLGEIDEGEDNEVEILAHMKQTAIECQQNAEELLMSHDQAILLTTKKNQEGKDNIAPKATQAAISVPSGHRFDMKRPASLL